MKGLQDPHHRPGKETLRLQDRAKSPFQCDALLNRDGKMTEIRDLVSEEVCGAETEGLTTGLLAESSFIFFCRFLICKHFKH